MCYIALINTRFKNESMTVQILFFGICYTELVMDSFLKRVFIRAGKHTTIHVVHPHINEVARSHPVTRYPNGDMCTSPDLLDITDRGSQFTTSVWSWTCHQLSVQLHIATTYHPQANGMVERFHRTMKASLIAWLAGPNCFDGLPAVLLGIRTFPKEAHNAPSAEFVYGEPLTVHDFIVAPHTVPCTLSFSTSPHCITRPWYFCCFLGPQVSQICVYQTGHT